MKDKYILVVDDDWMNREVIEAYLHSAGHEVRTASNGKQALNMAEEEPPSLVVLDVNMPGMNGLEVCKRLKASQTTRFTPVMVITALETDSDKIKAIEAGADDFLTKPFNSLIMLTRVKSLLRIRQLHEELEDRNALLRRVLNRYVSQEITDVILADPEKNLKLGGETRWLTIFFADIRGFTAYAEQHPAEHVLTALNQVFSALTHTIFEYHGTLDKYIGDEIMGFFGAPVASDDDTLRAARMTCEMQRVFKELQDKLGADDTVRQLGLGIGMHSGDAAVGNVGSERAMNYTVIGDTVNIARRLQQQAPPGHTLISEVTYQAIADYVEAEPLQPLNVAGKSQPLKAYRLINVRE